MLHGINLNNYIKVTEITLLKRYQNEIMLDHLIRQAAAKTACVARNALPCYCVWVFTLLLTTNYQYQKRYPRLTLKPLVEALLPSLSPLKLNRLPS